jgi:DNA primase
MLFDGDPAGIKASFRGINLILEQGMNVKVVMFPDGEDPDSYVRSHRTSEVESFIKDQASDFIKFKTYLLLAETEGDPAGKAKLIKDIVSTIAVIPDAINRLVYIKECSVIMDMPEQTLMNELNKLIRQKFRKSQQPTYVPERETVQPPREKIDIDPLDISIQENHLMRVLLIYGHKEIVVKDEKGNEEFSGKVSDYIINDLREEQIRFENELYNQMVEEYQKAENEGIVPDETYFINHPMPELSATAIELVSSPHQLSENWKKNKIYVTSEDDHLGQLTVATVLSLKSRLIGRQLKHLTEEMKNADDSAEMFILQQQFYELKIISNKIDAVLTRTFSY